MASCIEQAITMKWVGTKFLAVMGTFNHSSLGGNFFTYFSSKETAATMAGMARFFGTKAHCSFGYAVETYMLGYSSQVSAAKRCFPARTSSAITKRLMVSRKQRRKLERTGQLKDRGAGILQASQQRHDAAARSSPTLQESLKQYKWDPFLFLGVAPLISWLVLITVRPELREQMKGKYKEIRQGIFQVQDGNTVANKPQVQLDAGEPGEKAS
jgi:hypothetical protein